MRFNAHVPFPYVSLRVPILDNAEYDLCVCVCACVGSRSETNAVGTHIDAR